MNESLYFKQLELGPMQNFVYLIGDKDSGYCAVVDPGWYVQTILRTLQKDAMKLNKILLTHAHPDHTNGVNDILQKKACKIYAQKKEAEFARWSWPDIVKLDPSEKIEIGKIQVTAIHT